MREFRFISATDVRKTCIKYGWFTCGDIEAYNNLFEFIGDIIRKGQNVSVSRLMCIAEMIKDNSDTEYSLAEIMFVLNDECCKTCFE